MPPQGLEPWTLGLRIPCSNQLSYEGLNHLDRFALPINIANATANKSKPAVFDYFCFEQLIFSILVSRPLNNRFF